MIHCACYHGTAPTEHARLDGTETILQTSFPLGRKIEYSFPQAQQQYKYSCPDFDQFLQGLSCLQAGRHRSRPPAFCQGCPSQRPPQKYFCKCGNSGSRLSKHYIPVCTSPHHPSDTITCVLFFTNCSCVKIKYVQILCRATGRYPQLTCMFLSTRPNLTAIRNNYLNEKRSCKRGTEKHPSHLWFIFT